MKEWQTTRGRMNIMKRANKLIKQGVFIQRKGSFEEYAEQEAMAEAIRGPSMKDLIAEREAFQKRGAYANAGQILHKLYFKSKECFKAYEMEAQARNGFPLMDRIK